MGVRMEQVSSDTGAQGSAGRLVRRVRGDPLLRNSFYLTSTSVTVAAFGFAFWLLNSRLFTAGQIGAATTLISGATLISYISLFGFNSTFIRFLPTSRQKDEEINTGLLIVFSVALLAATLYVLLIPRFAPRLDFVSGSLVYGMGFVVLTAFWAVNLATDSVFIAFRRAQYNLVVDGFIQGATKLALPALVVGLGAYGVFLSSGLAAAAAVLASLLLMARSIGYRPRLVLSAGVLRRTWHYSAGNYLASLLALAPVLVAPIIVLDVRGPREAGFYYMAFQCATILFAFGYAVSQSMFAEGSHDGADLRTLLRRSARVLVLVYVPASIVVALLARWILLLFGPAYSVNATSALTVFALSAPFVALLAASTTVLRVRKWLRAIVATNLVYAVVILGLGIPAASHGLAWVAASWLIGNVLACALAAGLAALCLRRAQAPGDVGRDAELDSAA
jgi:O-antigen/teichoic acid export membrane protein